MSECEHSKYWVGQYGTCMVCRAEKAESSRDSLQVQLEKTQAQRIDDQATIKGLTAQIERITAKWKGAEAELVRLSGETGCCMLCEQAAKREAELRQRRYRVLNGTQTHWG